MARTNAESGKLSVAVSAIDAPAEAVRALSVLAHFVDHCEVVHPAEECSFGDRPTVMSPARIAPAESRVVGRPV